MSYPGLNKTLETISRYNETSSRVAKLCNEANSKLPGLLADTSRAYEALSKSNLSKAYDLLSNLDWEKLQAKAALYKKKPQDVIYSGLQAGLGDGVIEDKTGRLLEQADFLSYQDSKYILNCYPLDETQATVYIPESKRHSLFAQVAKAYAAWLGLKLVFIKEFSKVLELVKEKLATLNSSFVDTLRANENAPPDFMLSYSLTDNAPPKNNGKPFTALLFLSCVSNSRKELIA